MLTDDQMRDHLVGEAVAKGVAWAQSFFREATDIYKISATLDPEIPMFMERVFQEVSRMGEALPPEVKSGPVRDYLVSKKSAAPPALAPMEDYLRELRSREIKVSFVFQDFWRGLTGGPEYDARQMAAGFGSGPRAGGVYGGDDPIFDITRDLRRLDPDSRAAVQYTGLTPQQRQRAGVYFESDLPVLAREFSPVPRNNREAVLIGAREGIRRANMEPPGFFDNLRLRFLQHQAERRAFAAQRSQLNPPFLGILGTIEDAQPEWTDDARRWAADLGSRVRNLHPAAKVGIGATVAGAGVLGARSLMNRLDQADKIEVNT